MINKFIFVPILIILSSLILPGNSQSAEVINYFDLPDNIKISGILKVPLGEIIHLEGIVVSDSYRKRKGDAGRLLLKVLYINREKQNKEIIIPFEYYKWSNVRTPVVNENKKYIGYETGGFKGIPGKVFDYLPRATAEEFHFDTYFQVCSEEK